eukprot:TRINITY_DN3426_c0_g2_i13.p1 TRINITY_DN3426_c0_g2~~TRINITY_DN3426_c0_g2_i13.p1  ORF type:complete len:399 (-),score=73.47 TRINITY_DN3426_c0_g2_i13:937-2133(-)
MLPCDYNFLIKDTDTGETYDIRRGDATVLEHGENLIRLSPSSPNPWKDWWSKKRSQNTKLLSAAELGELGKVKELLNTAKHKDLAADVDTRGLNDFTPLHFAAIEGHIEIARILLEAGATVDALSTSLSTPLHLACKRGNRGMAEVLVEYKAEINAQDSFGNTPLHVLSESGFLDCLHFFLQLRPDITIRNIYGETAIELAMNVAVRNLLLSLNKEHAKENEAGTYKRTVIKDLLLHNSRADTVKSLVFNEQRVQLNSHLLSGDVSPSKASPSHKPRREKIIEAVKGLSAITSEEFKPTSDCSASKLKSEVGPDDFELLQPLGSGSFGDVYVVRYKRTGKLYAMKVLNKNLYITRGILRYAQAEKDVLSSVRSPFIAKLAFAFQTADELVLVIEYCAG